MLHVTHIIKPMWRIFNEVGDFKIGGRIINEMKFINNMAIIAKTQEKLYDFFNKLIESGRKYGMKINIDKPQEMKLSKRNT